MVCAIPIGLPSNTGRREGIAPINTTSNAPNKKRETEIFAVLLISSSFPLIVELKASAYLGSCKRRWYSGSSFNSLPILLTNKHAQKIPRTVEGIVTINTSPK